MNKIIDVSLIIPIRDDYHFFKELYPHILKQYNLPKEIIIVDSSKESEKEKLGDIDFFENTINLKYIKVKPSYPGKARNIGIKSSTSKYVAFLDSKTYPSPNWLSEYYKALTNNNQKKIIFGTTKYTSNNYFQKLILSATYGNIVYETVPGTLVEKNFLLKIGGFIEHSRSGEDFYWRKNIRNEFIFNFNKKINYITYNSLTSNIFSYSYKYFIYSIYTARIDILQNVKAYYMSILLIFIAFIIPRWNYIVGWDKSFLFIPNVTKIFIVFLIFSLFVYNIFVYFFKKNFYYPVISKTISFLSIFFISLVVYNWNYKIALLTQKVIFYVPHITKIYVLLLILLSIIIRGAILPYKRKIEPKFVLINWVPIGLFGLVLDISKAPGYILGYLYSFFHFIYKKPPNRNELVYSKSILVVCPFPSGVQAGQRLKYEQFFKYFNESGFSITISSFVNLSTWKIIYKKGFIFNKIISLFSGYFRRLKLYFEIQNYDIVYIFMWVVPYGGNFFERIYLYKAKNSIFDIEDNILIIKKNVINKFNYYFKSKNKTLYLIKNSDYIIASSPNLKDRCNEISNNNNARYICASIDIDRYKLTNQYSNEQIITIGWTGTFTSKPYLENIQNIFFELAKIRKYKLLIISDFNLTMKGIDINCIQWNKDSEIKDLSKIDIGIYPLTSDENKWADGKSGLKALQYMGMGIPVVASNVGNTKNIISNNYDGILVNNDKEWLMSLTKLIDNPNLRAKLGINGRKKVENNYSLQVTSYKYLEILNSCKKN